MQRICAIAVSAILACMALIGCGGAAPNERASVRTRLGKPQNLHVEEKTLMWDAVDNADKYIVKYDDGSIEVAEAKYDLSAFTAVGTYDIYVSAVGDQTKYLPSYSSKFVYEVSETPTDTPIEPPAEEEFDASGLCYRLLDDGTGYEVSSGTASLSGSVIIPDEYNSLPIKRIADNGFRLSGGIYNTVTTKLKLPARLEYIGKNAFSRMVMLENVIIPDTVTEIEMYAFAECARLKSVKLSTNLLTLGYGCFEQIAIEKLELPKELKKISNWAFGHCERLAEITFPDDIDYLGICAFADTPWDEAQQDEYAMFGDALYRYNGTETEVVIPPQVKKIASDAFRGNKKIVSVTIPTGVKITGDRIFALCTSLRSVSLPDGITDIPYWSFVASGITHIDIPSTVTNICNDAFLHCKYLESITIPDSVISIGRSAFSGCEKLEEIVLPDRLMSIDSGVFRNCKSLQSIELPDSLERIENGAFDSCEALEAIVIPKSVKEIGDKAFSSCTALSRIYYGGSEAEWNALVAPDKIADDDSLIEMYYYSEQSPTTPGKFWHYADDGVPTPWDEFTGA